MTRIASVSTGALALFLLSSQGDPCPSIGSGTPREPAVKRQARPCPASPVPASVAPVSSTPAPVDPTPAPVDPVPGEGPLDAPLFPERATLELLRQVEAPLEPPPSPIAWLPVKGALEEGQYVREGDVFRGTTLDRKVVLVRPEGDVTLEAGYWITYIGSDGTTPSNLRHGPFVGVSFLFP